MKRHAEEFTDTDPKAMEVWIELMRRKPAGHRLSAALSLTEMALEFSERGVRQAYPHAGDHEVKMRAAARRLDRDLMIRAFNWDPAAHGETG